MKLPCLSKFSFDDFVHIDDDISTSAETTDQLIISNIISTNFDSQEVKNEDEEPEETIQPKPTAMEYENALDVI